MLFNANSNINFSKLLWKGNETADKASAQVIIKMTIMIKVKAINYYTYNFGEWNEWIHINISNIVMHDVWFSIFHFSFYSLHMRFYVSSKVIRSEFNVFNFPTCVQWTIARLISLQCRIGTEMMFKSRFYWFGKFHIDSHSAMDDKKKIEIFTQFDARDLLYKAWQRSDFKFIMRS